MNTTQLECFVEVANCLNFSRAAEHLCLTQPAVSHQINTLENELGVRLFHRTSKSVRLTQEGFLFTQYAGEILKISAISKVRIKEFQQDAPLRLAIGCRTASELSFLRPALTRLCQTRPEVLPSLRLVPFDALETLLTEGTIHLMFSFQESALPQAHYLELSQCPVMCVCNPDHPLAQYTSVTLQALEEAGRIAVCRPPTCPRTLFDLQGKLISGRPTSQVLFCDNQEAIFPLVQAGYAFSLVTDFPYTRLPGLCYLPVPELEPLSFGALYLSQEPNPVLPYFLSLLSQSMQEAKQANI